MSDVLLGGGEEIGSMSFILHKQQQLGEWEHVSTREYYPGVVCTRGAILMIKIMHQLQLIYPVG